MPLSSNSKLKFSLIQDNSSKFCKFHRTTEIQGVANYYNTTVWVYDSGIKRLCANLVGDLRYGVGILVTTEVATDVFQS